MKIFFRILFSVVILASVYAVGYCSETPPLPPTINIVPPGANVPADLAKLSGKWVGTLTVQGRNYAGTAQHVIIVEKIDDVGVITVIYARGDMNGVRTYPPGFWARYKATWGADSKELLISYPFDNKQVNVAYKLSADGKLTASGDVGSESRKAVLHRE